VTAVQTNKLKKVTLGFYMASSSSFAEIKNSIGLGWLLRRYHVFLRQQHLLFEHGADLYLMGCIVQEHPSFASISSLERKLASFWYDSDDRELIDSSSNTDLKKGIQAMEKDKIIAHDHINSQQRWKKASSAFPPMEELSSTNRFFTFMSHASFEFQQQSSATELSWKRKTTSP
jgi:hypothetical protein